MKIIIKFFFILLLNTVFCLNAFTNEESNDLLKKAFNYENTGDINNAIIYYKKYLKLKDDEKIQLKIARLTDDFNEAYKLYINFIDKYPKSRYRFIARYELAVLYKLNNDLEKAIFEFEELAKISIGNAYWDKSKINTAFLNYELKNYKASINILNELLNKSRSYDTISFVYYLLGMVMLDQDKIDDAKNYFLICAYSFPESTKAPCALLELLKIFIKRKMYLESKKAFEILNQLYPDSYEKNIADDLIEKIKPFIENLNADSIELVTFTDEYDLDKNDMKRLYDDLLLSTKLDIIDLQEEDENKSGYYIQLGYLQSKENAKKMTDQFKDLGISDVFYAKTKSSKSSNVSYRVVIGPFKTEETANKRVIELKEKNIESLMMELRKEYE